MSQERVQMNRTFIPFVELKEYSAQTYKSLVPKDFFYKNMCKEKNGVIFFKFVGVVLTKNCAICVFPKGYILPSNSNELKRDAIFLIETLNRYKIENRKSLEEAEVEFLKGIGEKENVAAALWLLQDFSENGLINIHTDTHILNGKGNIHWKHTINRINPVISNGQPIYLDYYSHYKSYDQNNIIRLIHNYAVSTALETYGWLFYRELKVEINDFNLDIETIIYTLQSQLQNTFSDREITLYSNIIDFLSNNKEENNEHDVTTLLTPYFHTVWEKICDFIFQGQKNVLGMPKPYWEIDNERKYTNQIPDTLFINNNHLYILDAKYYRTEKLPGWHDLVKQFFYALTLVSTVVHPTQNTIIHNIMIFPSRNKDTSINYLGSAKIQNNENFGEVKGYTLDIVSAMKYYSSYSTGELQKQLIDMEKNTH